MGPVTNAVKNIGNGASRSVGQAIKNGSIAKRCSANL